MGMNMAAHSRKSPSAPISAIIVTYNRLEKLKATISAYSEQQIDHLLIVNNASSDGTGEWLDARRSDVPRLEVLHLDRNTGGAGGFEAGVRWADQRLQGWGWIVLQDDDAYPVPGVTAEFRRRLAQGHYEGCAAVAAAVLTPEGRPADINRPILNFFRHPRECWRRVRGKAASLRDLYHVPDCDLLDPQTRYRVHAASFVGLYLNLERLPSSERERYPQSDLFIYGDDTLYTTNLDRRGLSILLDAGLRYVHDTATGYEEGLLRPEWKHFYISRNSLRVYRALSPWAGPLLYLLAMTRRLRTILATRDSVMRARSLRGYRLGLVDAVRGRRFRSHGEVVHHVEGGG